MYSFACFRIHTVYFVLQRLIARGVVHLEQGLGFRVMVYSWWIMFATFHLGFRIRFQGHSVFLVDYVCYFSLRIQDVFNVQGLGAFSSYCYPGFRKFHVVQTCCSVLVDVMEWQLGNTCVIQFQDLKLDKSSNLNPVFAL